MPLSRVAMTAAPKRAPSTVPRPPFRLVPPITQAATASSSISSPMLTVAGPRVGGLEEAGQSDQQPQRVKAAVMVRSTGMPDTRAASSLPPIATQGRPKGVCSVITCTATATAQRMRKTAGTPAIAIADEHGEEDGLGGDEDPEERDLRRRACSSPAALQSPAMGHQHRHDRGENARQGQAQGRRQVGRREGRVRGSARRRVTGTVLLRMVSQKDPLKDEQSAQGYDERGDSHPDDQLAHGRPDQEGQQRRHRECPRAGQPAKTRTAATPPIKPTPDPAERSICPGRMTISIPTASTAVTASSIISIDRLRGARNSGEADGESGRQRGQHQQASSGREVVALVIAVLVTLGRSPSSGHGSSCPSAAASTRS